MHGDSPPRMRVNRKCSRGRWDRARSELNQERVANAKMGCAKYPRCLSCSGWRQQIRLASKALPRTRWRLEYCYAKIPLSSTLTMPVINTLRTKELYFDIFEILCAKAGTQHCSPSETRGLWDLGPERLRNQAPVSRKGCEW